jgi:dolichyl-phosphate beta-glucosyltransferase
MKENIILSVIVPAFNEEEHISHTLIEIAAYLKAKDFGSELIVIDDGSIDNTAQLASSALQNMADFKLIRYKDNRGKGYAVKKGMFEARGKYALFMDADNSTSITEFDKFLPYLSEGYDIVIASRRLKDSKVEEAQPFLRAKMGQFYIFLSRIILGLRLSDFNCGFKVYNTRSTSRLFELQSMDDWSFDVELLFLATKFNLKIKEIPVRWVHKSGSKVRPFRDAAMSFISILKIKINDIRRLYNR